jgi:hypothetical protein
MVARLAPASAKTGCFSTISQALYARRICCNGSGTLRREWVFGSATAHRSGGRLPHARGIAKGGVIGVLEPPDDDGDGDKEPRDEISIAIDPLGDCHPDDGVMHYDRTTRVAEVNVRIRLEPRA